MANVYSTVFALNCPFVSFDCNAKKLLAGNYINFNTHFFNNTYIKIMRSKAKVFSAFTVGARRG